MDGVKGTDTCGRRIMRVPTESSRLGLIEDTENSGSVVVSNSPGPSVLLI